MSTLLRREDTPDHLFKTPELDLSDELFKEPLKERWFILGAQTLKERRTREGVEEATSRQSVLLPLDGFASIFEKLDSVGNVFRSLGKSGGVVRESGGAKDYSYLPFHRFEFSFSQCAGEPLVFLHSDTSSSEFIINPDLWIFLELEEKAAAGGIWWDPRRGEDVLIRRVLDDGDLKTVEIRTEYLLKYLRARQWSLLVGHYRHRHLFNPPKNAIDRFVKEDLVLGSPEQGVKAVFQNWGLRESLTHGEKFLQRRLHLWFEVSPPDLSIEDPWDEMPSFDLYSFTLPTAAGPVAPARRTHLPRSENREFAGNASSFMANVYFRQEVLGKYEGAAGYEVQDDGSVRCRHYWSLSRSTFRLGNELIGTHIGDFAEGVPFEEWPHWKQYTVEPPNPETSRSLAQEPQIPEAVNSVVGAFKRLNTVFAELARAARTTPGDALWRGSSDSLAGRQLKWVYPARADDDEFLKRATLASTLFLDALTPPPIRAVLSALGPGLHQSFENSPQPLGSRNLLQRMTLAAVLISRFHPSLSDLPILTQQAEGKAKNATPELQVELETLFKEVRATFAPLAFLYDLRTHGGLAHTPKNEEAAEAAAKLGLPREHWHRNDYLQLLKLIAKSIDGISGQLKSAADTLLEITVHEAN
jgi:hypothetical protein